jgi:hypothetical protein
MHRLRSAHQLVRLVLAWFALAMGVAFASPAVQPQSVEFVCSSSGAVLLLVKSADGTSSSGNSQHLGHDCPLCSTPGTPPPVAQSGIEPAQPLAYALQGTAQAHVARHAAAPLPARGPPAI